jgi:hypothetical protein
VSDERKLDDLLFPEFLPVILVLVLRGGVRLSPFGTSATNWSIVPTPDDG